MLSPVPASGGPWAHPTFCPPAPATLSTSSAIPPHVVADASCASVPRLEARAHQRLSAAACGRIPLTDLHFRALRPDDRAEVMALHREWFPVNYDHAFYNASTNGEIMTMVATHCTARVGGMVEEDLVGMITMTTTCESHRKDIVQILGDDCETLCVSSASSSSAAEAAFSAATPPCGKPRYGCLAYILTLGVVEGFRRRGLARELLRRAALHVQREMPHVQAIYLHVAAYNQAAVQLYENMQFLCVAHYQRFYLLQGMHYDAYLYALYVNGGQPPWSWRSVLGIGAQCSQWLSTTWGDRWGNLPICNAEGRPNDRQKEIDERAA